jgi:phage baseplate assembly protein W
MDRSAVMSLYSINFPYTFDPQGVLENNRSATKMYLDRVVTLLSTNIGQRPMLLDYGVDWSTSLFENDQDAMLAIPEAISAAMDRWLPNIQIQDIRLDSNGNDGVIKVFLTLVLPNNNVSNLTISTANFFLDGTITR